MKRIPFREWSAWIGWWQASACDWSFSRVCLCDRRDRCPQLLAQPSVSGAQTQKAPRDQASLATLIQSGRRDEALERIRAGADVNEPQPDGTRPIHWAVYRVDYELVDALIAKKAQVNVTNDFGSTPIAEAAKLGDARLLKSLLNAGAGPEGANAEVRRALMLAITTGELPAV